MSSAKSKRIVALPGNEGFAYGLAEQLAFDVIEMELHRFPDGESMVRVEGDVDDVSVVLVCTLDRPDSKFLPLYFAASTLRELGASQVVLVAPYLAYMRQDRRFHSGEGVTARYFAGLLSGTIDGLVTVDPHLHRIHELSEVYSVPNRIVHAAPAVADWIRENISRPVLIGPDSESEQWVADVANRAGLPFTVLQKVRHGDRDVKVSLPDVERWRGHTPVLVDDIISTGRTMIETISHLKQLGMEGTVCVGVHGVFAQDAYAEMLDSGSARIVTSNTVLHESNAISLESLVASAIPEVLDQL